MPIYDYTCRKCGKKFSVTHSITEHDHKRVRCPKCSSRKLERRITSFLAKTSKKS
jgi:putative FmdB family regulatory protein